jgi:5'-3' exonuclease
MGIPSYFSWIVRNHTNIIKKFCPKTIHVNNLYLDCNSIIYDAIRLIDFTKLTDNDVNAILTAVCVKIDEYIHLLKPDNNIFIAFDGVAPVAKLDQQRERRYKSLYQNKITRSICQTTDPDPWNTTAITPGTLFMKKLTETINLKYNNTNSEKYNAKNIIISCSDEYGEGEHKLFKYIRDNSLEHSSATTIIYGLDADLIMLSINHLPISKNIYLFRETPHFIQSICADLEPNESYLMDIPELANIITNDMNNGLISKHDRIYDYIFLCFFLGNDFMPHFPAINIRSGGIEKMLNAYKATIGGTTDILTDGKTIYWKNVKRMVQFLADNEETFLKTEAKNRDRREKNLMPDITNEEKLKKFDSIPMYERSLEKYINPYKANWQIRYYKTLFNTDINDEKRKQISTNYLEGLEWTMKYYTSGCPDWRWSYQYNYPPLLYDLLKYIPTTNYEFVKQKLPNPVTDLVQLCYVLPKQSLHFLPPNLYKELLEKHDDWYKTDCTFVWAYCRYFWESHVVLPHIDIKELEEFVDR